MDADALLVENISEWARDSLTLNEQFFCDIMARKSYIRWDNNVVRFVLDQPNFFDLYSASSLKQQSPGRHAAPVGNIILIQS